MLKERIILDYNINFDVAAIVLYLIIIMLYFYKPHVKDRMHRIYLALFGCALLAPIFDILSTIGITYHLHSAFVLSSSMFFYLTLLGVTFFFLEYLVFQLDQYTKVSKWKQHLVRIPVIIVALMILTNDFTGWIFTYGVEHEYHAGKLIALPYAVGGLYFVVAVAYMILHKKGYEKSLRYTVYNICVVNLVFITLQLVFSGILLICFGFAVSMVLLFLTAHTKNSAIDRETGMLNRYYLSDTTSKMMYSKLPFTLVLVRIADYSMLSGIYGIMNVERLSQEVARALKSYVQTGEAFQTNISTYALIVRREEQVDAVVNSINERLAKEWVVNGQVISFAYLITTISYPEKINSPEQMLSYLTYFEKMKKMRYGIIPSNEVEIRDTARESQVEKAIRRGLDEHHLSVYYQPMCIAKTQKFVTAEALVRLIDPEMGFVSPAEFIPVAEHSGLMIPVGNYVLEEVCKYISSHDLDRMGLEYIEVNLSVVQCLQRDFLDIVHATMEKYHVEPKRICFEVTETASNCAPEIFTQNLQALVEEGFLLALDDFGSGYGNLQRMVTSNFKIVKFDKDITQQTCNTESLRKAFKKMVALFHSLELEIVSEGVETKEQYEYLRDIGVDYIQGYYFSKPVPQDEFTTFLEEHC